MNKAVREPASRSIAEYLKFDPSDPARIELYRPGANWGKASEYPQIKPVQEYSRSDFLRLAWEILRRMPRYRRQYRKLGELGFKKKAFSFGNFYFTDGHMSYFQGWEDLALKGHKCVPRTSFADQTLGEYVALRKKKKESWFVMHRHKWVLDLWGLSYAPNPDTDYADLENPDIFAAPAAIAESSGFDCSQPRVVSTFVRQNELLWRIRLDTPLDLQLDAIRREFPNAQNEALKRQLSTLDPLALPKRKMPRKSMGRPALGVSTTPGVNEMGGRALLKQLEMSPIWLRTWDAVQQARIDNLADFHSETDCKNKWPRLSRVDLVARFEKDYGTKSSFVQEKKKETETKTGPSSRRKSNISLDEMLFKSLRPSMVFNWRERSENYIEESDDAFRQLVASAFAKSNHPPEKPRALMQSNSAN